jgi:Leucine-rich repeat (LRR) protein
MLLVTGCKSKYKESVFIADNNLSSIPDSVFQKTNLTSLSISQAGYTIYPSLSNLGAGISARMPLAELPEQLGQLRYLEYLKISGSSIKKLPSSFSYLTNIEKLDLSLNPVLKIAGESDKLRHLNKLKYLNIFGTDFTDQDLQTIRGSFKCRC